MLVLEIEASKSPRINLKMVCIIQISPPHGARYPIALLRPKIKVKLSTQSAEIWICMGKWAFKMLRISFLKNEKASDNRTFYSSADTRSTLVMG